MKRRSSVAVSAVPPTMTFACSVLAHQEFFDAVRAGRRRARGERERRGWTPSGRRGSSSDQPPVEGVGDLGAQHVVVDAARRGDDQGRRV